MVLLINRYLTDYHFNEVHTTTVHASASEVFGAIQRVKPSQVFLLRALIAMRTLFGRKGVPFASQRPILQQATNGAFVLLEAKTNREIVLGIVGQFWRFNGGIVSMSNAFQFINFDNPAYAKAVINFVVEDINASTVKVTTETRIYIPDPEAYKKFQRYWMLIYPGSWLIRKMMLRAIKKYSEKTKSGEAS